LIEAGKRRRAYFYTLLGGEPFLYPGLWEIIESHPECYFQVITNGLFLDGEVVARLRRAGNVTPLVSMDGGAAANDARRGAGVHEGLQAGLERLRRAKLFFGIASTVTSANLEEVLSDDYVRHLTDLGALYLWYYIYRPMGRRPEVRLCLGPDQMALARRKILALRRRHPLLIVDTYWTAEGRAFCPAAEGLGFHVGPWGDIEPCPPLSFAAERIQDAGDPGEIIDRSVFLRSFRQFAGSCTQGCVILEQPGELAGFLGRGPARDFSGRDALAELRALPPRASHHLPGAEVPEDHWFYRFLKRQIFFGMGAYG
jgi:MoaA/NifB/PqqE/SkfB family radical SAM enzyme